MQMTAACHTLVTWNRLGYNFGMSFQSRDVIPPAELENWAQRTQAVMEVWLFGSRARGDARLDSDVDLALALMPPAGAHNWALGDYFALSSTWRAELERMVGRHVSLEVIVPGTREDQLVRREGILIWHRPENRGPPA